MAKLLKAQESPKTIVTKWKEKLQENFKQEQQKHWERKLKKWVGTIRKILQGGGSFQDAENLFVSTPALADPNDDTSSDSEPSETDASQNTANNNNHSRRGRVWKLKVTPNPEPEPPPNIIENVTNIICCIAVDLTYDPTMSQLDNYTLVEPETAPANNMVDHEQYTD